MQTEDTIEWVSVALHILASLGCLHNVLAVVFAAIGAQYQKKTKKHWGDALSTLLNIVCVCLAVRVLSAAILLNRCAGVDHLSLSTSTTTSTTSSELDALHCSWKDGLDVWFVMGVVCQPVLEAGIAVIRCWRVARPLDAKFQHHHHHRSLSPTTKPSGLTTAAATAAGAAAARQTRSTRVRCSAVPSVCTWLGLFAVLGLISAAMAVVALNWLANKREGEQLALPCLQRMLITVLLPVVLFAGWMQMAGYTKIIWTTVLSTDDENRRERYQCGRDAQQQQQQQAHTRLRRQAPTSRALLRQAMLGCLYPLALFLCCWVPILIIALYQQPASLDVALRFLLPLHHLGVVVLYHPRRSAFRSASNLGGRDGGGAGQRFAGWGTGAGAAIAATAERLEEVLSWKGSDLPSPFAAEAAIAEKETGGAGAGAAAATAAALVRGPAGQRFSDRSPPSRSPRRQARAQTYPPSSVPSSHTSPAGTVPFDTFQGATAAAPLVRRDAESGSSSFASGESVRMIEPPVLHRGTSSSTVLSLVANSACEQTRDQLDHEAQREHEHAREDGEQSAIGSPPSVSSELYALPKRSGRAGTAQHYKRGQQRPDSAVGAPSCSRPQQQQSRKEVKHEVTPISTLLRRSCASQTPFGSPSLQAARRASLLLSPPPSPIDLPTLPISPRHFAKQQPREL